MNTLEEKDKSNPFTERDLSHEDDWVPSQALNTLSRRAGRGGMGGGKGW